MSGRCSRVDVTSTDGPGRHTLYFTLINYKTELNNSGQKKGKKIWFKFELRTTKKIDTESKQQKNKTLLISKLEGLSLFARQLLSRILKQARDRVWRSGFPAWAGPYQKGSQECLGGRRWAACSAGRRKASALGAPCTRLPESTRSSPHVRLFPLRMPEDLWKLRGKQLKENDVELHVSASERGDG